MPYVLPEDRKIIDRALEPLAQEIATEITNNLSLIKIYRLTFIKIANSLDYFLKNGPTKILAEILEHQDTPTHLALVIYEVAAKYEYEGAFLGELNYAITRLIQRVPQIKVARGDWKDELRYWLCAATVEALDVAASKTSGWDIGISGVFRDIWIEYNDRVKRPYETAQILKSGDCYETPFINRLVELVDEDGKHVAYLLADMKRDANTPNKDLLDIGKIVLTKNPGQIPSWAQPFVGTFKTS